MTTIRLLLRSLLLQASWNPRDLLGTGTAWILGPWLDRGDPDERRRALARHGTPFNAHPYLAGVALGALIRLEEEGTPEEDRRRFRDAIRSPLGSLGDSMIWAGWLPASLLVAGVALLLGLPPPGTVALFLLLFNAAHLPLRVWGIRVGLAEGLGVARVLQARGLWAWAERSRALGVLLVGLLLGVLSVRAAGSLPSAHLWWLGGAGLFVLGVWRGGSLPPHAAGFLTLSLTLALAVLAAS
jgi:mannose PTS system EIID component